MITVPLAHKLPLSEAVRLGASVLREYQPGEDITVPRASAEMLAAAAQLQVHPRDRDAVRALLDRGTVQAPAVAAPAPVVAKPARAPGVKVTPPPAS